MYDYSISKTNERVILMNLTVVPANGNVVSAAKFKNALKRASVTGAEVKLDNIRINGSLFGCSGFLRDEETGHIVYVSTDHNHGTARRALYREAKSLNDYTGGVNRYADYKDIVTESVALLRK